MSCWMMIRWEGGWWCLSWPLRKHWWQFPKKAACIENHFSFIFCPPWRLFSIFRMIPRTAMSLTRKIKSLGFIMFPHKSLIYERLLHIFSFINAKGSFVWKMLSFCHRQRDAMQQLHWIRILSSFRLKIWMEEE